MKNVEMVTFPDLGDERGQLVVAEGNNKNVPFDIKRIFYIFGTTEGTIRGEHANIDSQFVLINVKGSCKVRTDDGYEKNEYIIDKPNKGIYLGKMIWKEMFDFSEDSILLVIASEHYNEKEYIRDYDEFLKVVRKEA